jgi:hypothetical protein
VKKIWILTVIPVATLGAFLLLHYEIPQKGISEKSFWLIDRDSFHVVGVTNIPFPPHLK